MFLTYYSRVNFMHLIKYKICLKYSKVTALVSDPNTVRSYLLLIILKISLTN